MSIDWVGQGNEIISSLKTACRIREQLFREMISHYLETEDSFNDISRIPLEQMTAIVDQFQPSGSWDPVLSKLDKLVQQEIDDADQRRERLRAEARKKISIGFIGSERAYARLSCFADLHLIREAEFESQLKFGEFDRLIVETTTEPLCGEWRHKLSSLSGEIPEMGRQLLSKATEFDLPTCLFATVGSGEFHLWRELSEQVGSVVIEGMESDWDKADLSKVTSRFIKPATEPCANAALCGTDPDTRLLVPVASDVFNDPEFAEFLQTQTSYGTLFTEYHYDFVARSLRERLPGITFEAERALFHSRMTKLIQESRLVLIPGSSLRSKEQLLALLLDAIASGSIPVIFGETELRYPIVDAIDRVWAASELQELQRLYRIQWYWEHRWRFLFRKVCEDYTWKSDDRTAIFGKDPLDPDYDEPLITAIIVSKRPQLVASCIDAFRNQTARKKELIVVLNMSTEPESLPALAENESVFRLPPNCTVGQCLNAGVASSNGKYWTKMDDDDFYVDTYLEDLQAYFRATQADCLGRQAVYFYFDGANESRARDFLTRRCFRLARAGNYLSGATLSGRADVPLIEFSDRFRNAADSIWVESAHQEGYRVVSYDSSSLTVFRNADESFHTWKMPDLQNSPRRLSYIGPNNIHAVLNAHSDAYDN
ncbi:glycosyltransferase family 2 protein [Aestuariibius insulae]|uniref:glycosyltransferase family 2 protein n=1 Tax=Aestuariibius insulae TaxID=2058287 RepID=UPI00398E3F48